MSSPSRIQHTPEPPLPDGATPDSVTGGETGVRLLPADCVVPAGAVLAEGPIWHGGRLLWVDIERGEIHEFDPRSGARRHWRYPHRIGFLIPTARGDFVAGADDQIVRWDRDSGGLAPFASPPPRGPGLRFNDAKCDPAGRLWAGTMAVSEAPGCGTLYRVEGDGGLHPEVTPVSISNGLAWSPDGATLYFVDSPTRRVDAFDVDPERGNLSGRRTVVTIPDGFPDGMCSDLAGNLWIALWGGWCVACHDPRTGHRLAEIRLPVEAVTSCCFGDGEDLWITTAGRDLDAGGHRSQPLAGGIFKARVGIGGTAPPPFRG